MSLHNDSLHKLNKSTSRHVGSKLPHTINDRGRDDGQRAIIVIEPRPPTTSSSDCLLRTSSLCPHEPIVRVARPSPTKEEETKLKEAAREGFDYQIVWHNGRTTVHHLWFCIIV